MIAVLEWSGCVLGVLGALLLATNTRVSKYGWVAFLASNGFWIAYGIMSGAYGVLVMQSVFTVTSAIGLWRWLLRPGAV